MNSNTVSPMGGYNNWFTVNQIEKEREMDQKKEKLLTEFDQIDTNDNRMLEWAEIKEALDQKMRGKYLWS